MEGQREREIMWRVALATANGCTSRLQLQHNLFKIKSAKQFIMMQMPMMIMGMLMVVMMMGFQELVIYFLRSLVD